MVQAVGNSRKEEREVELRAFGASSTRAAGFSHAPLSGGGSGGPEPKSLHLQISSEENGPQGP